jgi:hypothetical protein
MVPFDKPFWIWVRREAMATLLMPVIGIHRNANNKLRLRWLRHHCHSFHLRRCCLGHRSRVHLAAGDGLSL